MTERCLLDETCMVSWYLLPSCTDKRFAKHSTNIAPSLRPIACSISEICSRLCDDARELLNSRNYGTKAVLCAASVYDECMYIGCGRGLSIQRNKRTHGDESGKAAIFGSVFQQSARRESPLTCLVDELAASSKIFQLVLPWTRSCSCWRTGALKVVSLL